MKFTIAAVLAAAVAGVSADYYNTNSSTVAYTTEVVTAYSTYCPEATTITHNAVTYSASAGEYITYQCPCTLTKPITTTTVETCYTCKQNATAVPTYAKPTVVAVNGAGKTVAYSGAGLAAVLGLAILL